MKQLSVGQSIPRIDAVEKVTGSAVFGDDMDFSRGLYGKALRSPFAHAEIVAVDIREALLLPGVKAIVTGKDIQALGGEALKDYPFLAVEKVRYAGEPVAVVAAIRVEIAEKALDLIRVEYRELPVVVDPEKAMAPKSPLVHERLGDYHHLPVIQPIAGTNICHHVSFIKGDIGQGFAESDAIFRDTFTTQMVQHGAIEPHMAIARVDASGSITIWVTNDGPHRLRKDLAEALGLPLKKIRVISPPYMGGGFGAKGGLKVETLCIALALKTKGRPVKMVLTREEVFTSSLVRHPSVIKMKTGVKKDGRILAREVDLIYDTGAYSEKGPTVCQQASTAAAGPYNIPHVKVTGYCVYTNRPIAGAFRGYGHTQAAWAHESQMDIIAAELGINPVEIRLKNAVREGDISPTGQQILNSVGLTECIEKATADVRWEEPGKKFHGKGFACGYKNTKTPSGSSAIVKVSQDGSVELLTSTVEIGQGAKTILAQMVAEEIGVPVAAITVSTPDTDITPYDASTTSSRSTFHMGNAVKNAARDVRDQIFQIAAQVLGEQPTALGIETGCVFVLKNKTNRMSYADVLKNQCRAGIDIIGRGSYHPDDEGVCAGPWSSPSIFWMYGAHYVEVEVDIETGQVRVTKIVGAHDVGKAINPNACEGQIEGGIIQGLGPTLMEEMLIGAKGEVRNPNFLDYKLPTAMDIPEIIPIIVEVPCSEGPWGAKGLGEMTTVPIAPAIANAIYDAVGVRIKDLPITPEKLLKAMKEGVSDQGPGVEKKD
ncbi:MAG: xanthine dehydrogenase family protein molybdopterin-binding subunit [Desulfobacterales bacterium]|nr:xanthine dehydrogenase family protein molybdopterin-binding subunit [Desulfobacterales bacterium]